MRLSNLARVDHIADLAEVRVVAAVEADLQLDACFVYGSQRLIDAFQIEVNRLFTKDLLARRCGLFDDLGVRVGRRADNDRVDVFAVENFMIVRMGGRDVEPRGNLLGGILLNIGDCQYPGVGDAIGEVLRVELANTAHANHADIDDFSLG